MPNYGDVVLNLSPDWSRTRVAGDQSFVLTTVGHENGIADAYRTDQPDLRHQFRWVDPKDQTAMSVLRTKHYVFCVKKDWTKNPHLWEWDGEDYILHNGQRLMARDASYYYADQQEADRAQKERDGKLNPRYSGEEEVESAANARMSADNQDVRQSVERLEARGATLEDERGRPLKPLSKTK